MVQSVSERELSISDHDDSAWTAETNTGGQFTGRDTEYTDSLKRLKQSFFTKGPWAIVGRSKVTQGWKLHLSSIPVEAIRLLEKVVPVLDQKNVPYKIAKDAATLSQLNEGDLGGTQIGKFMTIYPACDDQAKEIAEELADLTKEFQGPVIVSDMRLGAVVYTRYGGFNPVVTKDRLGQLFLSIYNPDGSLQLDSYTVPFVCPEGIVNPFEGFPHFDKPFIKSQSAAIENPADEHSNSGKLFGPGYLILELVKEHPKGSVFRGLDLRSQDQVGIKILKQGKQHCLSDEYGRDMKARLRRQQQLHQALSDMTFVPKADSYFEVNGDGYLPIDSIGGQSIESISAGYLNNRTWGCMPSERKIELLSYLEQLLIAVQAMHTAGYVHRDLTASNVWIGTDAKVYLLDLELCHHIDDLKPAFGLGTAGFMSPNQAARRSPMFEDDIYALGCCMILLITGMDPRRVLFANDKYRMQQLVELTHDAPVPLLDIVSRCVQQDSHSRPALDEIIKILNHCLLLEKQCAFSSQDNFSEAGLGNKITLPETTHKLRRCIVKAQQGLLEDAMCDPGSGLWLSTSLNNHSGKSAGSSSSYEIQRSANRGVSGVAFMLSRLSRFGFANKEAINRVQKAIQWLIDGEPTSDQELPGLHFGKAGVAMAISEAIAAGMLEHTSVIDSFLTNTLTAEPDWPDITHGAAGQGVAALYCADRLNNKSIAARSHRYADYLIEAQREDGSWIMPAGVEGMSGQTLTGFAHGVAGIVYFLAEYARRFDDARAEKAWRAGVVWLINESIVSEDGERLDWRYSDTHPVIWKWWCHGAPGIALTFLRLYEQTGEQSYADIARKALRCHPKEIRYANLSQCHGLSGLGEIYLEAGRVLGDSEWYERAAWIKSMLLHMGLDLNDTSTIWLVEDPNIPTADLMVGSGSVIHFLLRFLYKEESIGFPLLFDPLKI